jgi:hypothetical protein
MASDVLRGGGGVKTTKGLCPLFESWLFPQHLCYSYDFIYIFLRPHSTAFS